MFLSVQLFNAHNNREYCNNFNKQFKEVCNINTLHKQFASDYVTSKVSFGVYKISLLNFANSVDAAI